LVKHEADERLSGEERIPGFILSGIDQLAGGTWFGMNRTGRIGLLTNITEQLTEPMNTSRGSLVSSFLLASSSDLDDVGTFLPRNAKFAGFNLLLFAPTVQSRMSDNALSFESAFVSNGGAGGNLRSRPLSPEEKLHGAISNGVDGQGASDWPKVRHGIQEFASILQKLPENDDMQTAELLFELLRRKSPEAVTERRQLRNTIHVEPLRITTTSSASADGYYGTRLSTVLLIRKDGQVFFVERDVWKMVDGKVTEGSSSSDRIYRFQIDIPGTGK